LESHCTLRVSLTSAVLARKIKKAPIYRNLQEKQRPESLAVAPGPDSAFLRAHHFSKSGSLANGQETSFGVY